MDPVWLKATSGLTEDERRRQWLNGIQSSNSLSSGRDTVRGYQRRQQTLLQTLIISVIVSLLVGILGNILGQALLPNSNSTIHINETAIPLMPIALAGVGVAIVTLFALFMYVEKEYGPHDPAKTVLEINYASLLQLYSKNRRGDIEYLVGGVGIEKFDEFARKVLRSTIQFLLAVPLLNRSKIAFAETVTSGSNVSGPAVSYFGDLSEVARQFRVIGVHATIELRMNASSVARNPIRVKGVGLTTTITVTNPENHISDLFFQRIESLFPYLAEGYANSFWIELELDNIASLRQLIERTHDFLLKHYVLDNLYLMNCYPYDGKRQTLIVIDKNLIVKNMATDPYTYDLDFIYSTLRKSGLLGCYVTDSENWLSPADNRRLFGGSSTHLDAELAYVRPTKIITIGTKSKMYITRNLRRLSRSGQVGDIATVNVLENTGGPFTFDKWRQLEKELKQELVISKGAK